MSHTAGHGPYAREHPRHWHTKDVEELPEGWKDDMIRRQLEECSRQMIRLTDSTIHTPRREVDENMRAQDARTLATLRREVKEVRGLAHRLNQPVGRVYAYACDADLGDRRCAKDISSSAFSATGTVGAVVDARRFAVSGIASYASGWFSAGKLSFTSGGNAGRAMEIKRHTAFGIELWQAMSTSVATGDAVSLVAGCDKQFSTCKAKFANAVNFRGFPFMPGNDAVLSYPTAAQPRDGGSRYGN